MADEEAAHSLDQLLLRLDRGRGAPGSRQAMHREPEERAAMERACEIRICPNAAQRELIERTFGCARWACSRCLETRKAECERTGRSPSVYQLQKLVTAWKRTDAPWLAEVDSHALQQAARTWGGPSMGSSAAAGRAESPDARASSRSGTRGRAAGPAGASPCPTPAT